MNFIENYCKYKKKCNFYTAKNWFLFAQQLYRLICLSVYGLTKPNQSQPDHTKLDQTKPNNTRPKQTNLDQTKIYQII